MPTVPREEREEYRQWAKDNQGEQMDETGWVHPIYYDAFFVATDKGNKSIPTKPKTITLKQMRDKLLGLFKRD